MIIYSEISFRENAKQNNFLHNWISSEYSDKYEDVIEFLGNKFDFSIYKKIEGDKMICEFLCDEPLFFYSLGMEIAHILIGSTLNNFIDKKF